MTDLMPCLMCGGEAVVRQDDDPGYPFYITFNHHADCMMYAIPTDLFRSFATEAEAIAAWNQRAAPPIGLMPDGWQPICTALLEALELAVSYGWEHESALTAISLARGDRGEG